MNEEEERKLLKFLLDSLDEGVLVVDNKDNFYYGNKAFLEILNIDKKDVNVESFPQCIKDEEIREFFIHCHEKEEREFIHNGNHILMKCIPYVKENKAIGNIFILSDITVIKDSKTQLKELKNSLDMIEDILEYAYEGLLVDDTK